MFIDIKKQVQEQFSVLSKDQSHLFITDLDKDKLWEAYLDGFSDPIEKQEHNCSACRGFIKNFGNVVAIKNSTIITIWDFVPVDEKFNNSIQNLKNLVQKSTIRDIYISDLQKIGVDSNIQRIGEEGKTSVIWNHFSIVLPKLFVNKSSTSRESQVAVFRDNRNVFKRSLDEITQDSIETVLELIAQNSLYRGEESKGLLQEFLKHKKEYSKIKNTREKDNYCWFISTNLSGSLAKIRNTSIGTLLVDISEGKPLDESVGAFERMVAPANYKRPTALITKRMIEDAEKTIKELGFEASLNRKFVVAEDISVDNLLFVDRNAKKAQGIFNELKENVNINPKTLKKVEEIGIDDFVTNILPNAKGIQLLLENQHINNLMSIIGPEEKDSPLLFKWKNPFSWTYNNALADSMKERVKAAGGKVDGVLRYSIQWNDKGDSICDLDAHAIEPGGSLIYYSSKGPTIQSGSLDVDMIRPAGIGVENITWARKDRMRHGKYQFFINNFDGNRNTGFQAEIEFEGELHSFSYNKHLTGKIPVAEVTYSDNGFTIKPLLDSTSIGTSKHVWGIDTNRFQKVSMIMHSPNYWESKIGNRHTFFILDGARNDSKARGFFNEFLNEEVSKHRKVFEVLGSKLEISPNDRQLSGVGFSSTQRNSVICRVEGKFERLLKINF